jgi:hypothetical protein
MISLALFVIAAILSATPTGASANSLLSGYGGPGQGSQAILGSALLGGGGTNGGASGGGGDGGGAGTQGFGEGKSSTGAGAARGGERAGRGAGSRARGGDSHASGSATGARVVAGSKAGVYPAVSVERAYLAGAGGDGGPSGGELLYGLVALAALALTVLLTMRSRGNERTGGAS